MDYMIIVAVISILAAILVPNFLKARKAGKDALTKSEARALAGQLDFAQGLAADWHLVPAACARAPMGALPPGRLELIYEIKRGARAYEGGGRTGAHRFEIVGLHLYNLQKDEMNMGFHINFYMPGKREALYIGSAVLDEKGAPVVVSARGEEGRAVSLPAAIKIFGEMEKYKVTISNGGTAVEKE
jgi:hypothetical protein